MEERDETPVRQTLNGNKLKVQLAGITTLLSLISCLGITSENFPLDRYKVIIENNLFLPLGWKPPKTSPPLVLSGIVKSGSRRYAFIRRKDHRETYLVEAGQLIPGGWQVARIDVQKEPSP